MLQQWRDLLHHDVGDTRQVLRELLEGPLQFTPIMMGRHGDVWRTVERCRAVSLWWRPRAELNCRPSA
jgi:hypothetical protein